MSGSALSRHPVSALTAYNRLTNSSLEGQIAFASDWAGKNGGNEGQYNFSYPNSEASVENISSSSKNRFQTGNMAFQNAINNSILGTSFAPRKLSAKSAILCIANRKRGWLRPRN